ncbi:MAG: hypothetical protein KDA37_15850 [Planctomycetales bacterium]|nr:hypothetical protein [Planctomycetales bacterium]
MNYFAHALPHLADPQPNAYLLAGVAAPDWLNVTAKKTKCRTRHAQAFFEHADPRMTSLARGVARHHADDAWFHDTRAFNELSLRFAKQVRDAFGDSSGMRPWFLGHILVELLLDDALIASAPHQLDAYYGVMDSLDAEFVASAIQTMCGRPVGELAWFIDRYRQVRFLADYSDDQRLLMRLNQVMSRVRLDELPLSFPELLPAMRAAVEERREELTAQPA